MELWHILLFSHIALLVTAEGISKYFIDKIRSDQVLFFQYLTSVIVIPSLYVISVQAKIDWAHIPWWFILFGSVFSLGVYALYNAKRESLSKSIIMEKAATGLSVLLLVLFVGEFYIIDPRSTQGLQNFIGLVLVGIAAYLLYHKHTHLGSESTFRHHVWIRWISIFVIIMGVAHPIAKYMLNTYDPLLLLSLQYIGSFLTIAILPFRMGSPTKIPGRSIAGTLLLGFFTSIAVASLYGALALTSGTQVLAIRSIAVPFLTVLIGVSKFNERFTNRMYLPFILAIIAVYLLH